MMMRMMRRSQHAASMSIKSVHSTDGVKIRKIIVQLQLLAGYIDALSGAGRQHGKCPLLALSTLH